MTGEARRQTILYRVCDTPHETERLATQTEKFSLNGYRYEVDTCEECSAQLYGTLMAWADRGTCVGEPTVFDRPTLARERTIVMSETAPAVAEQPAVERRHQPRAALPRTAERWRLTQHALERIEERGFTKEQVLWACERPEVVEPEMDHGVEQRRRGRCLAVVDPVSFDVVTVKVAGETRHTWQQAQGA